MACLPKENPNSASSASPSWAATWPSTSTTTAFSVAAWEPRAADDGREFVAENQGQAHAHGHEVARRASWARSSGRAASSHGDHGGQAGRFGARRSSSPLLDPGRHRHRRRQHALPRHASADIADVAPTGIHFFGMGVSGGEEGALWGPSLMPGGDRAAYQYLEPILTKIAARTDDGPCVTYVGDKGAGHFVKMVHNGIEYGDMQPASPRPTISCRAGSACRRHANGRDLREVEPGRARVVPHRAHGEAVLVVPDPKTGRRPRSRSKPIRAGQGGPEGHGQVDGRDCRSTSASRSLTITAAIDGRVLVEHEGSARSPPPRRSAASRGAAPSACADARRCLRRDPRARSSRRRSRLVRAGHAAHSRQADRRSITQLRNISARRDRPHLEGRVHHPRGAPRQHHEGVRAHAQLAEPAARRGLRGAHAQTRSRTGARRSASRRRWSIPRRRSRRVLAYFDSYRTARLPPNLTQAQRDAFGAHTYERTDKPEKGFVHSNWLKD